MPSPTSDGPTSYQLPAVKIPKDVQARLDPWIAELATLTPAEATARLHERWASIRRPSATKLRAILSEFEVRAVIDNGQGGLLYAERPGVDHDVVGNSFYLPPPISPDVLNARLAAVRLSGNEAVHEFLTHFAGLAEDLQTSGHFVDGKAPWPTFTDSWDDSIEGFNDWRESLMLYEARNGCRILVHPTGKVGWWVMQERVVRLEADTFDEFVEQFADHRKLAWPYDPYGPPDNLDE